MLHDCKEDCPDVTLELRVAAIVDELTSDKEKIKQIGKTDYLIEKMEKMSSYALRLKLIQLRKKFWKQKRNMIKLN